MCGLVLIAKNPLVRLRSWREKRDKRDLILVIDSPGEGWSRMEMNHFRLAKLCCKFRKSVILYQKSRASTDKE
jgi:hypothetical protein